MNDKLTNTSARGPRGSGRTTKLLKASPIGTLYLTQSSEIARMFDAYLEQIGRTGEIVCKEAIIKNVIGDRRPVAIDHCVLESGIDDELLLVIKLTASMILINDEDGDVIVVDMER